MATSYIRRDPNKPTSRRAGGTNPERAEKIKEALKMDHEKIQEKVRESLRTYGGFNPSYYNSPANSLTFEKLEELIASRKHSILINKSQGLLQDLLSMIEYPKPYPSVYDVIDIQYNDGKVEIILENHDSKSQESDSEPGYGIQQPEHKESKATRPVFPRRESRPVEGRIGAVEDDSERAISTGVDVRNNIELTTDPSIDDLVSFFSENSDTQREGGSRNIAF